MIDDNTLFTGNAYYRKTRTSTYNGDLNEDSLGESVYGQSSSQFTYKPNSAATAINRTYTASNGTAYNTEKAYMLANYSSLLSGVSTYGTGSSATTASGYARSTNLSGNLPYLRCIAQAEMNIEPNEKCTGILTKTYTNQAITDCP